MRRRRLAIEDLRTAIDCLPVETRVAMLEGVRTNDIIVGAYADRKGGVCPMLAAHRCGGRTSFLGFARAWDRFANAKRKRRATEREIAVLISHLEASLLREESVIGSGQFAQAIAEHQATARTRRGREAAGTGWAWLRSHQVAAEARDRAPEGDGAASGASEALAGAPRP